MLESAEESQHLNTLLIYDSVFGYKKKSLRFCLKPVLVVTKPGERYKATFLCYDFQQRKQMIAPTARIGVDVSIPRPELVNIYGCHVGDFTKVGPFVEIQKNASIGSKCKISSHSFICEGVTIEDGVFVGHGVMFTNDIFPQSLNDAGEMQDEQDWSVLPTLVKERASIGSNATILCGITIGRQALIGAGAVVTRDVADFAIVAGVPARVIGDTRDKQMAKQELVGQISGGNKL